MGLAPRIVVVGAGAIGGITAALLKKGGYDVTLVCKHQQVADIANGRGLRVTGVADDVVEGWQVVSLDAGPGHAAALCVPGAAMPLPGIDVEWVRWPEHEVAFSTTHS